MKILVACEESQRPKRNSQSIKQASSRTEVNKRNYAYAVKL